MTAPSEPATTDGLGLQTLHGWVKSSPGSLIARLVGTTFSLDGLGLVAVGVLGVVVGVGFLTQATKHGDDLMGLIGFIAAPAMIISSLALAAVGVLLGTLGIRTFRSEHPATRSAFITAGVVAMVTVAGAFSTPEGFGTRSSLAWLSVGLLHLNAVLFLLVARRAENGFPANG